MAIFMLLFSGFFPYLKLVVLSVAWFVPPRFLGGVKRRGSLLLWMDVLAKLSVVDIITMLLLAAVVLVFIGGPTKVFSSDVTDYYYSVEAIVTPLAGFYCLTAAQRISRIGSKYLLEWHLRIVALATKDYEVRMALPAAAMTVTTACSEESKEEEMDPNFQGDISGCTATTCSSTGNRAPSSAIDKDGVSTLRSLGWSEISEDQGESNRCTPLDGQHVAKDKVRPFNLDDELTEASGRSQKGSGGCIDRILRIGGTAGAVFSATTVCSVFIIGIVIGPSIKLDLRSLWNLALESGSSFKEAIQSSFFRTISMVLLQARFIMKSARGEYIGLLLLFCLVGVSSVLFPLTQAVIKFGKWQRERARRKKNGLQKKKKPKMPHYIRRLYLWRGMDVYIISFILAVWQLGAVSAYVIHLYCTLLDKLFSGLAYVGLAESSEAQCFRIQASLPLTVFIVCASFVFLILSFYFQSSEHWKRNRKHVEMMIENEATINRSLRRGLSRTARSSSFWNLGGTQLINDDEDVHNVGSGTCSTNYPLNNDDVEAEAEAEVDENVNGRTSPV